MQTDLYNLRTFLCNFSSIVFEEWTYLKLVVGIDEYWILDMVMDR